MDSNLRDFYFEMRSLRHHSLKSNDILVISDQEFLRLIRKFEEIFDLVDTDMIQSHMVENVVSEPVSDVPSLSASSVDFESESELESESLAVSSSENLVSDQVASNAFGVTSQEQEIESESVSDESLESIHSENEYEDLTDEIDLDNMFDESDLSNEPYVSAGDASKQTLSEKNEEYGNSQVSQEDIDDSELSDAMDGMDNDITESEDNRHNSDGVNTLSFDDPLSKTVD